MGPEIVVILMQFDTTKAHSMLCFFKKITRQGCSFLMFNIIGFIFYFLISTTLHFTGIVPRKGVRKGFRDFSPFCINISLFLFISRREYLSKLDWLVVSFVFVLPLALFTLRFFHFFVCTSIRMIIQYLLTKCGSSSSNSFFIRCALNILTQSPLLYRFPLSYFNINVLVICSNLIT